MASNKARELAQQWLTVIDRGHDSLKQPFENDVESLANLLTRYGASVALAEARWWKVQRNISERYDRMVALEQAAGEGKP